VRKIEFGLKGARNYFWYRARVNLSTALATGVPVGAITPKKLFYSLLPSPPLKKIFT